MKPTVTLSPAAAVKQMTPAAVVVFPVMMKCSRILLLSRGAAVHCTGAAACTRACVCVLLVPRAEEGPTPSRSELLPGPPKGRRGRPSEAAAAAGLVVRPSVAALGTLEIQVRCVRACVRARVVWARHIPTGSATCAVCSRSLVPEYSDGVPKGPGSCRKPVKNRGWGRGGGGRR